MKVYCQRCHKTVDAQFKDFKLICMKCKKIITENKCPNCQKLNNWGYTGFYCNMSCFYDNLYELHGDRLYYG